MGKVMNIIGEKAAKTYRIAAEETGRITNILKLKAQMADDKSKIKSIYEKIGQKIYENYVEEHLKITSQTSKVKENEDKIPSDIKQDCEEIDSLADEIENVRMQILKLNYLKQCPKCNSEIDLDFSYCPSCGEKQELTDEQEKNNPPATIVTTDSSDAVLTKRNVKKENNEDTKDI